VIFRDCDFSGIRSPPRGPSNIYRKRTLDQKAREASWHCDLFKVFRKMYALRAFRLVLRVGVWDCVGEYAMRVLKRAVAVEKAGKRLDYLPSEPLVIYDPQASPQMCRNMNRWPGAPGSS